ncbi:MAG TPA: hypothetical protein VM261_20350 [Kofleriaceae bacterium]|nr:hypothetical protein [Kofleriaceae bacterium]
MARPCMRTFLLGLLPMIVIGCAAGFEGRGDDDDQSSVDARPQVDAPIGSTDARIVDAPVSTQIDAPVSLPDAGLPGSDGGVGGCTTHAQCGSGMCCFGQLMCVPGDPLPLPPPFDCLPQ